MSAMSIALSGMNAAQTWMNSSAHNVANMNTEGFKRQATKLTAVEPGQGVQASVQKTTQPMSLEQEVVEQMQASTMYKANAKVISTQDKMMGSLLSMKA